MNGSDRSKSSNENFQSQSFSRRLINFKDKNFEKKQTKINLVDHDKKCFHCGKINCRIDSMIDQFSEDSISNQSEKFKENFEDSFSKSQSICQQNSSLIKRKQINFSSSNRIFSDQQLFSSEIFVRLASSTADKQFRTENRAGYYQICSNGRYILADDWSQTYKGYRLSRPMKCLTIYNQYQEQCVLMLPEFSTMTLLDSIQSLTWNERLQLFLFVTCQRIYQCEPESGQIHQITEYEIPSNRHSLCEITTDQNSLVFVAYQHPSVSLDLWRISPMSTWSLIQRFSQRDLFSSLESKTNHSFTEIFDSSVLHLTSMRYSNDRLNILVREEQHWSLHLFVISDRTNCFHLFVERRILLNQFDLRLSGECFQMEVLPGQQGWLFSIRRPYLIHLDFDGLHSKKVFFGNETNRSDSISNLCILDERGKRRENLKYLVLRDTSSIRFYKL